MKKPLLTLFCALLALSLAACNSQSASGGADWIVDPNASPEDVFREVPQSDEPKDPYDKWDIAKHSGGFNTWVGNRFCLFLDDPDAEQCVWTSSDESVVFFGVDKGRDAYLEVVGEGEALVTAAIGRKGWTMPIYASYQGYFIELKDARLQTGESVSAAKCIVEDCFPKYMKFVYVSSDTRVISVDTYLNLVAVGPGTATITAFNPQAGVKETCTVTVK